MQEGALQVIDLWQEMFAQDNVADVAKAVKALIATRSEGYPPTIGEVRAHIVKVTQPQGLTPEEAWAKVYKAICRSSYYAREEFAKLPIECQRVVGSPEQLKAWANVDAQTTETVIASNFMKSYRARATQTEFEAKLPADLKQLIGNIGNMPQLESGE